MGLARDHYQRPLLTDSALSPERFGYVHPGLPWQDILRAYDLDQLDLAMQMIDSAGVGLGGNQLGTLRMIGAEAEARSRAQQLGGHDWLSYELIVEEAAMAPEEVEVHVRGAVDDVGRRFGYSQRPPTLVTILPRDSFDQWTPSRYGYHIAKREFDKVCLPGRLTDDPAEFSEAMRHEYGHVMAFNRTLGRCPRWLHEAVAMVAANEGPSRMVPEWLGPHELDRAFRADDSYGEGETRVWFAYQQAHEIGRYLKGLKGEMGLGTLLDAFSDNSALKNVIMAVINQESEDEALRQVYGLGTRQVFENARPASH
ncbi:MAG: hypothetical protein JSS66_13230 [Armatimonadetes bacterium]|nr:hypothetical protein [Armatimonadota bacterium]